jgi:hypothetical protein
MWPHDSVIVNGAYNSTFASIVRTAMIVNSNTRGQAQAFDQAIAVEEHIEIDPHVTICGPRLSG